MSFPLLLRQIRRLTEAAHGPLSDRELLARFAGRRDEAAFEAVVRRHGLMVLRVCQRALGNSPDAEDVFQATFLVLARKAAALRWQPSVGTWLYEVASRLCHKTQAAAARRRVHEGRAPSRPPADPSAEITCREAQAVLDEELNHLPSRYRAPLVLCYLEGLTRDEAARQLSWSLGTLKRRLEQARARLRGRLTRRGVAPAAALSAALLVES